MKKVLNCLFIALSLVASCHIFASQPPQCTNERIYKQEELIRAQERKAFLVRSGIYAAAVGAVSYVTYNFFFGHVAQQVPVATGELTPELMTKIKAFSPAFLSKQWFKNIGTSVRDSAAIGAVMGLGAYVKNNFFYSGYLSDFIHRSSLFLRTKASLETCLIELEKGYPLTPEVHELLQEHMYDLCYDIERIIGYMNYMKKNTDNEKLIHQWSLAEDFLRMQTDNTIKALWETLLQTEKTTSEKVRALYLRLGLFSEDVERVVKQFDTAYYASLPL